MIDKIKYGAVAWIAALALLAAWSGVAAGRNSAESGRVKDQAAQLAKRATFYHVIADDAQGNDPGPVFRLARDLRDTPTDELDTFEGDTNKYGGVSHDLGYDPFDDPNCDECGSLDDQLVSDIGVIRSSGTDAALAPYQVKPADSIGGAPGFVWFLWFISYPLYVGVVWFRSKAQTADKYKGFGEERQVIAKLREAQHSLPPGTQEWDKLDNLADSIQAQIDTRASYVKTKTKQMKIDALTQEASDLLDDMEAGRRYLN